MSSITVTVETEEFARMVDELSQRLGSDAITGALEQIARSAIPRISGIPVGDTGTLSSPASFEVRARRNAATIRNTTPYARFVFRGAYGGRQPPRPPNVPESEIAAELVAAIEDALR